MYARQPRFRTEHVDLHTHRRLLPRAVKRPLPRLHGQRPRQSSLARRRPRVGDATEGDERPVGAAGLDAAAADLAQAGHHQRGRGHRDLGGAEIQLVL